MQQFKILFSFLFLNTFVFSNELPEVTFKSQPALIIKFEKATIIKFENAKLEVPKEEKIKNKAEEYRSATTLYKRSYRNCNSLG